MKQSCKMFIGYDSRQQAAADACRLSIEDHSDINIQYIALDALRRTGLYWREQGSESTEFAFTRFLAPYLKGLYGYAIFCDGDFIWNCDPLEILDHVDPKNAISVVKHNIQPDQVKPFKMDGQKQQWYPKKNWSSLIVFNCNHAFTRRLMPITVSESPAGYLHELNWCDSKYIGSLPHTYNYLVGYYNDIESPKAIHFTDGGPWHPGYENVEFADKWNYYKNKLVEKYGRV